MDYRDMLKRYIRRIRDSEGDALLPIASSPDRTIGGEPTATFTIEEVAELEALEAEVIADEARDLGARD